MNPRVEDRDTSWQREKKKAALGVAFGKQNTCISVPQTGYSPQLCRGRKTLLEGELIDTRTAQGEDRGARSEPGARLLPVNQATLTVPGLDLPSWTPSMSRV